MESWEETFSWRNILGELCRHRVRLASRREAEGTPAGSAHTQPSVLDRIFPPRQFWHRFRPGHRQGIPRAKYLEKTLFRSVVAMKEEQSTAPWAIELDRIIEAIQRRALHDPQCRFTTPRVVAATKTGSENVFRPICVFGVEDAIIGSLAGRYLRERFNPHFD